MPYMPEHKLSDGDRKFGSDVMDKFKRSQQAKQQLLDKWRTQAAYVDGKQYGNSLNGSRLRKAPSHRVRLTHNICAPIVNTATAKLTSQEPGWRVIPRGAETSRVNSARAGELLLKYLYRPSGLLYAVFGASWWACVNGTGFIHRCWDSYKKRPVLQAYGPHDVFPDYNATSMKDLSWTILVHTLTEEDIARHWQDRKDLISEGDEQGEDYRRDLRGYSGSSQKMYQVLEYEELPNGENEEGIRAFVCNGITLYKGPLPNGRLALTACRVQAQPGRFWGTGLLHNILDIQREINRTISQAIELRNTATNPPWIYARGSIPKSVSLNAPDAKIPYNPNLGARPERIPPVPIPQSLLVLAEQLERAAMDSAGVHEISQGRGPSGVISGKALGTLADQDTTKFGPTVREIEHMLSEVGAGILEDWRDHHDEEVTISVLGPGRMPEIVNFHAAMLGEGPIEVEIMGGSMLPRSPSHQADLALQMFQLKALDPDPAVAIVKLKEAMGTYGLQGIFDDDTPDRMQARRENYDLADPTRAEMTLVSWADSHITHISEHLKRLKEPDLSPEERMACETHLAAHYEQLQFQGMGLPTYQQAWGVDLREMAGQVGGAEEGAPPGGPPEPGPKMGGGTPAMNEAVGPRGPGVPDFDIGVPDVG